MPASRLHWCSECSTSVFPTHLAHITVHCSAKSSHVRDGDTFELVRADRRKEAMMRLYLSAFTRVHIVPQVNVEP